MSILWSMEQRHLFQCLFIRKHIHVYVFLTASMAVVLSQMKSAAFNAHSDQPTCSSHFLYPYKKQQIISCYACQMVSCVVLCNFKCEVWYSIGIVEPIALSIAFRRNFVGFYVNFMSVGWNFLVLFLLLSIIIFLLGSSYYKYVNCSGSDITVHWTITLNRLLSIKKNR